MIARTHAIVAVKSAVHFRSGFEEIAGSIHNIDAQAVHTSGTRRSEIRRSGLPVGAFMKVAP
jgi:microcystin degradation protein MlrC